MFDVVASAVILGFSPLLMFLQRKPLYIFVHCVKVLLGRASWVSYSKVNGKSAQLPRLKSGVLPVTRVTDSAQAWKMDVLYAKDYRVSTDIMIIFREWRSLGE